MTDTNGTTGTNGRTDTTGTDDTTDAPGTRSRTSAFRRAGATVAVACAVTGSIVGLGQMGALAAPGSSPSARTVQSDEGTTGPASAPKVVVSEADLAAFAASPYADDALNLAVVWGLDTTSAQAKAGAKIAAGTELPFAVGAAATADYTLDQRIDAFALDTTDSWEDDYRQVLGLAAAWGSTDFTTAKATVGGLLLAHQPVPATPTTFTEDQQARAFTLSGYEESSLAQLTGLWKTDARSAQVRAGGLLLAGEDLPL